MFQFNRLVGVAVLFAIAFAAAPTTALAQASAPIEWKVSDGGNGHWYQRVDMPNEITWTDASLAAQQAHGNLVSLNSAAEQVWVFNNLVFGKNYCQIASWAMKRGIWIGLFQNHQSNLYSEPAGGWEWSSGEPFTYLNWAPSEPNNGDYPADFVGMYADVGTWDDTPNDAFIYCFTAYVIEWSTPPNLLVNGGLEGVSYNSCGFITLNSGSTAIPGWIVSGANNIDWVSDQSRTCCIPPEGACWVDLNGSPLQTMGSALRQTVSTIPGMTYVLSAMVVPNPSDNNPGSKKKFRLSTENKTIDFDLINPADGNFCSNWQQVQLEWIATQTSSNVEVRSLVPNSWAGIFVDDIRVVQISPTSSSVPSQYSTIQSAINAAPTSGWTIQVAPGTYNEAIDFKGKAITVKASGARASTIIDGTGLTTSVVRAVTGETSATVLQGFTIRNGPMGSASGTYRLGGGIFISSASPTIRDCAFTANQSAYGGGMYALHSNSLVENCTFSQNSGSADGGGMQLFGGSPIVRNCVVSDNTAGNRGGGFHVVQHNTGAAQMDGCTISGNRSNVSDGGGISMAPLAGAAEKFLVSNCTITNNSAQERGGGLWALVNPSNPQQNVTLTDNTICNNTSAISKRENVWALFEDGGNTICDCFADVTGDGDVDSGDFSFVLLFFGEPTDPDFIQLDQDMNGFIDTADLSLLLLNYGTCP